MNPTRAKSGSVDSADSVGKPDTSAGQALPEYPRTIPPFIWSHDIPRGFLFIGTSILRYALMLAVMCAPSHFLQIHDFRLSDLFVVHATNYRTYSAPYIISILIGLSVGEIAFGRYAQFI